MPRRFAPESCMNDSRLDGVELVGVVLDVFGLGVCCLGVWR